MRKYNKKNRASFTINDKKIWQILFICFFFL